MTKIDEELDEAQAQEAFGSPLEEIAGEPSLDELFGEQPELPDAALRYFIAQERAHMVEYHKRVEEKKR